MTPTPDQTPEEPKTAADYARGLDALRKRAAQDMADMNSGRPVNADPKALVDKDALIAALRARLAEAEKERDEWKEQAESVPYNTLANINDTCRTRGFMEGPSGRATEDRVIALAQAYDTLRATNATLAERVRRLEEALTKMVTGFYGHHLCENDGRRCMACELAEETLKQLPPTPGAAVEKEGE